MMKLRRITCYELGAKERDDTTRPILHSFSIEEAEQIQAHLESGDPLDDELRRRATLAFAHASVIKINA